MKTIWEASARQDLRDRLERLSPAAERRWGKMSAPQMVTHLVDSMRMANGELQVPAKKLPIRFTPLKQFIIYVAPFPRSAPTAPQLIPRPPGDWPSECRTLCTLIDQFAARDRSAPRWPDHPAFGKMTAGSWGVLTYRHIDHHLRQFGA